MATGERHPQKKSLNAPWPVPPGWCGNPANMYCLTLYILSHFHHGAGIHDVGASFTPCGWSAPNLYGEMPLPIGAYECEPVA